MTRLFADNIGIVSIHEKDVALPANIEVSMIGNAATGGGEYGLKSGVIASGFSCFITDFATSKKSQYQLKQSLDHETHIIPFGEAPEQIMIKGVTFGFDQINSAGKGSAGESSGKDIEDYRVSTPDGTYVSTTDTQTWTKTVNELWNRNLPEAAAVEVGAWIDDWASAVDLTKSATEDFFSRSKPVIGLNDWLKVGLQAIDTALDFLALPGELLGRVISGLGLKAEAQKSMTRSKNSQFFPLSFPELNLLFTHLHLGSTARVAAGAKLYITYCGVRYSCAIDSMSFQSDKTNNSINFSMSLIGLSRTEYYPATIGETAVNTRATILGRLLQTFGGSKVDKAINANPQVVGVADAKITVGRLVG